MNKKNVLLVIVLLALTASYAVYFTDWFRPKTIEIFHSNRSLRHTADPHSPPAKTMPVTFGFPKAYRLTMLKIVPVSALETNKFPQPVWHLDSISNSAPIKSFYYGESIPGLKAAIAGSRPVPLEPGVTYRLFVEAGSAKGEHDFETKPVP